MDRTPIFKHRDFKKRKTEIDKEKRTDKPFALLLSIQ